MDIKETLASEKVLVTMVVYGLSVLSKSSHDFIMDNFNGDCRYAVVSFAYTLIVVFNFDN